MQLRQANKIVLASCVVIIPRMFILSASPSPFPAYPVRVLKS